jgi:hypothetical protein
MRSRTSSSSWRRGCRRHALRLVFVAQPIPVRLQCSHVQMKEYIWLVFVGNNSYHLGLYDPGRRTVLDAGQIDMVAVPARSRWTLARLIMHAAPCAPALRTAY